MADRSTTCSISETARHSWAKFGAKIYGPDVSLEQFLDRVFALPPESRPETREERPPIIWNWIHVTIDGRPWRIWGSKNGAKAWEVIHEVHPAKPTL